MKFCSYNYVLNEVPNNNHVTSVAKIVLNEVPNSNDATYIANNVCLTTIGILQFSISYIDQPVYAIWVSAEEEKKHGYLSTAKLCRASFTSFIVTVYGVLGHEAVMF